MPQGPLCPAVRLLQKVASQKCLLHFAVSENVCHVIVASLKAKGMTSRGRIQASTGPQVGDVCARTQGVSLQHADTPLGEQQGKQQPVQAALSCMDALFDLCQVHVFTLKDFSLPYTCTLS